MYRNIGKQIKVFASILCWLNIIIGILISVLWGCAASGLLDSILFKLGLHSIFGVFSLVPGNLVPLVAVIGILLSVFFGWLSGLLLYAFGELVDRTKSIDEKLNRTVQ